jgi:hypothetical protein
MSDKPVSMPAGDAAGSAPADDLALIHGIGPAIQRRLNEGGIFTFARLAALSPAEVLPCVEDLTGMSVDRIEQQDWTGQARELASRPAPPEAERTATPNRQHYATFTVELLLDEDNEVRRTRVAYIQGGNEDAWAGWEERRMVQFITRHAAPRLPVAETALASPAVAQAAAPAPAELAGTFRMDRLDMMPPDRAGYHGMVRHNQPFIMELTLDMAQVTVRDKGPLQYTATVYGKNLNDGSRQIVGEARGSIMPRDQVTLSMEGRRLPRGIYRLESVATLALQAGKPSLMAYLEGGLLHVI